MFVIRFILIIMIMQPLSVLASDYDVHDLLYRSLIGESVKGTALGVRYDEDPEILTDDLYLVKKATISYKYSPLNVRGGVYPIPFNSDDIEVSFEVVGRYNGKDYSINLYDSNEVRHFKYKYYEKKFEGLSISEPQFISCSAFIDHVYHVSNTLKEKNVTSYEDSHPNKIYYLALNKIISSLDKDPVNFFCKDGFSLVIQRTPPTHTEKPLPVSGNSQ